MFERQFAKQRGDWRISRTAPLNAIIIIIIIVLLLLLLQVDAVPLGHRDGHATNSDTFICRSEIVSSQEMLLDTFPQDIQTNSTALCHSFYHVCHPFLFVFLSLRLPFLSS